MRTSTNLTRLPREIIDRLREPLGRFLRIEALGGIDETVLFARRCLYKRRRGTLLVTEVFLPAVLNLGVNDESVL